MLGVGVEARPLAESKANWVGEPSTWVVTRLWVRGGVGARAALVSIRLR